MGKQSVYPQSVSRWQLLPVPGLHCEPNSLVHPPGPLLGMDIPQSHLRDRHRAQAKVNPTCSSQGLSTGCKGKGTRGLPGDMPTPGRILHRCTLLLQDRMLWTCHRFHFCPVPGGVKCPPAHPGPQLAESVSPNSQPAAPFLKRDNRRGRRDLPYTPVLHLQSPEVPDRFSTQLSKMQTTLGTLAASLLSGSTASLRGLSARLFVGTLLHSVPSVICYTPNFPPYMCKP